MKRLILGIVTAMSLFLGQASAQTIQSLLDQLGRAESQQTAKRLEAEIWEGWLKEFLDDAQKEMMTAGIRQMGKRDLDAAEKTFSDLIQINPGFVEAWNKRATVRYLKGDLVGSEADVFEVLAREPRHFGAISGLGLINLRRGDLAKAVNAYENLLKVNPFSQNALDLLPRLKQKLGISDI